MKLSQWLSQNIDSHGIYGLGGMLADMKAEVEGLDYAMRPDGASLTLGNHTILIGAVTLDRIARDFDPKKVGPKGAFVDPEADMQTLSIGGYQLSAQIARALLGASPGDQYIGRGFAYQADLRGLAEAGF